MTTLKFIETLLDWLLADPAHVVAVASALAAVIPTPDPATVWGRLYRLIDLLALNILKAKETGTPTPPPPAPPPPTPGGAAPAAAMIAMLAIALTACAETPPKTVFELRAAYDAAVLVPAARYAALPRCPQPNALACAEPGAVEQLRKADGAAQAALDAAEDVVRKHPELDATAATTAARDAITATQSILALYNIR